MNALTIKTISFTGHRPDKLGGYNENNSTARWVKDQLSYHIRNQIIYGGFNRFIWGGALGVDQWAAFEVLELKKEFPHIMLDLYQPFADMDIKWFDSSRRNFKNLASQSDKIITVCEGGYAAWKMQKRNEAMVDNSDLVIAVWDGSKGGTFNCVGYAFSKSKELFIIDPKSMIE